MNISLLAGIFDTIKNWFSGFLGAILSFFPKILYQLMSFVYGAVDMLQYLVRKLAGLDNMVAAPTWLDASGTNASGDLALWMINTIFYGGTVLTTVFWSMIILGVFMLALTTFIAVIKSEYTATSAKDAAKGPIIKNALKGLVSFAVVPVVCFFGLILGNILLKLVDKITNVNVSGTDAQAQFQEVESNDGQKTYYSYSIFGVIKIPTTNTPISGVIFQAAAYRCNRARTNAHDFYDIMMENDRVSASVFNYQKAETEAAQEYNASLIDEAFANTYRLKNHIRLDREPFIWSHMFPVNLSPFLSAAEAIAFDGIGINYFDKCNTALVWFYYDLWAFDYITCFASLVVITKLLVEFAFGLMKRVFELTMLFLIAAPIASLRPLDNGNGAKQWTTQFFSKAIGVFGPIAGLNLFFIILSILNTIRLTGFILIDKFIQVIFVIVGLVSVKDLIGTISKLIGAEDTLSSGAGVAGQVKETAGKAAKVGKLALGVTGKIAGNPIFGAGLAKNGLKAGAKAFGGSQFGQFLGRGINAVRSHFDENFGNERGIDAYMEEQGLDPTDATARKKAAEEFKKMSLGKRHRYISARNRTIRDRYKASRDYYRGDESEMNAAISEYDSQDGHIAGDFKRLSYADKMKYLQDRADRKQDTEAARNNTINFDKLSKEKQEALIQQAREERIRAENSPTPFKRGSHHWGKEFDNLSDDARDAAAKRLFMKDKEKEIMNSDEYKHKSDTEKQEYLKQQLDIAGFNWDNEFGVDKKPYMASARDEYIQTRRERSNQRADRVLLGEDARTGITGAITDAFKELKNFLKGLDEHTGGLFGTVAKELGIDEETKKKDKEKKKEERDKELERDRDKYEKDEMKKRQEDTNSLLKEIKEELGKSSGSTKLDPTTLRELAEAITKALGDAGFKPGK